MRATWEALHAGLVRSVRTLKMEKTFNLARTDHAALAPFAEPGALIAFLHNRAGDRDQKDQLLGLLVAISQGPYEPTRRELASALLWLSLWPGLDAVYRRRLRLFLSDPDELVSEIVGAFTRLVEGLDLGSVRRVAATLVRSTERDLLESFARHHGESTYLESATDIGPLADVTAPERPESELGLLRGLTFDEELKALRAWLTPLVGEDTELLIGVLALDESQREAALRLGLSHEAARKRFQRALGRVRRFLAASMSHPGPGPRV